MDTSKEYILMCEKAEEIRKGWKTQAFDIYQDAGKTIRVIAEDYGCEFRGEDIDSYGWERDVLWLPRQDQLQEMVKSEPYFAWNYIGMLGRWASKNITYSASLNSMEQLWLAFVMKENYNKIWNGENWRENV